MAVPAREMTDEIAHREILDGDDGTVSYNGRSDQVREALLGLLEAADAEPQEEGCDHYAHS
jgi:hypothetical protein